LPDEHSKDGRYDAGMKVRRSVLGDAHVDRAEARKTEFDADFQRFITEGAWGSVWTRPGLSRPTRSLLTLVILASLGHWEEFTMHIRAARNTGATRDEIKEALFHVAVYAGVPAANRAYGLAKGVYQELDAEGGTEQ
jgi:4-carboxymuconolactone decarboxylase